MTVRRLGAERAATPGAKQAPTRPRQLTPRPTTRAEQGHPMTGTASLRRSREPVAAAYSHVKLMTIQPSVPLCIRSYISGARAYGTECEINGFTDS